MNFETFSKTYWYIWLLAVVFIVVFLSINIGGFLYFRKKRKQFLRQSNPNNLNSSISSARLSRYKPMLNESSSLTITTATDQSILMVKSEELITSTPNSLLEQPNHSIIINQKDFQRQALTEHNSIRALYQKSTLKLNERLNISAQSWANQCAQANVVLPSRLDWRINCQGQPFGENIISTKSIEQFNGTQFTRMIFSNGDQSKEAHCLLNEMSTEVGFGLSYVKGQENTQQQWIGVAHYYPYHQLTTIQP